MRAEVAKVRYLPMPRWTAAALAAITLVVGVVLVILEPSDPGTYISVPGTAVSVSAWVATLIFGVWLSTLDFASGTMQRTLTAEPRRTHVLSAKLVVTLVVAALAGLAAAAAAGGLSHLAARQAGVDLDSGDLAATLFGQVPEAVLASAIGFGFGLLSRSVGGGIALGIVFILVFDGFISYIPGLEHFTYGALTQDLSNGITGTGETHNGLVVALLGSLAWCVLVIAPGWIRYLRSDLK
jgi:ABC-2 type transport system permease protein